LFVSDIWAKREQINAKNYLIIIIIIIIIIVGFVSTYKDDQQTLQC